MRLLTIILLGLMVTSTPSRAQTVSWTEATKDLVRTDALIPIHVDHANARVFFEFPAPDADGILGRYIYVTGLTGGLGSNPVGLDRSGGLTSQLLVLRKVGTKVFAEYENTAFQASGSPQEKTAVANSFARSIVWSGDVLAQSSGKSLVDMTSFLVRDAGKITARLKGADQGDFTFVPTLSRLDTNQAHGFATNLEFDALLTFASNAPGDELYATTPDAAQPSLIMHTSFMALPDRNYKSRAFDERAAMFGQSFVDMSAPLGGGVVKRLARRWRLEKVTPGEAPSRVKNPIVYYVDNAAPEPIRSALVEGASWWARAFEAAGYIDAYQVKILPEGAHPQDARYNVINWVHRATRGWSYGGAVMDPRTGEILRGIVTLGSLRVRQDITIFEGLVGTALTGSGAPGDPVEQALARIRQLAAHEVGHTLGFAHNMAASSYMDRASVMDYPAPLVTLNEENKIDITNAYSVGIGPWDIWTTKYLYADFDKEEAALAQLITEADKSGMLYVADQNSRPISSGHLNGALWDNGPDPVKALEETLAVRSAALARFGENNLKPGEPWSQLQTKIVPIYLYHRYQLLAAAKALGGMEFKDRRVDDGRAPSRLVERDVSMSALNAILASLTPAALDLNEEVLTALSPLGFSNGDQQFARESFARSTGPAFDHRAAARAAADLTFTILLHPERLNRMAAFNARTDTVLGAHEALGLIADAIFTPDTNGTDRQDALTRLVQARFVAALMQTAQAPDANEDIRALARAQLEEAARTLKPSLPWSRTMDDNFSRNLRADIKRFLAAKSQDTAKSGSAPIPPGSPIGSPIGSGATLSDAMAAQCWHCDTQSLMGNTP